MLRCVVLRSAECCVVRLCCVALCGDLLFVVSSGCVPVALRCVALCCIVLQSAVCFVDLLCCVALRCVVVMHMSYLVLFRFVSSQCKFCFSQTKFYDISRVRYLLS